MAKTAAERQADYRARRATTADGSGDRRLNTWVSSAAHLALVRIANRDGVTQRETLERFILDGYVDRSKRASSKSPSAPTKRDAVTEDGAVKAPSYGLLESRVVLLNAENMGLADALQSALDEVAALKDALADAKSAKNVTRHGKSTSKNPRRNT